MFQLDTATLTQRSRLVRTTSGLTGFDVRVARLGGVETAQITRNDRTPWRGGQAGRDGALQRQIFDLISGTHGGIPRLMSAFAAVLYYIDHVSRDNREGNQERHFGSIFEHTAHAHLCSHFLYTSSVAPTILTYCSRSSQCHHPSCVQRDMGDAEMEQGPESSSSVDSRPQKSPLWNILPPRTRLPQTGHVKCASNPRNNHFAPR